MPKLSVQVARAAQRCLQAAEKSAPAVLGLSAGHTPLVVPLPQLCALPGGGHRGTHVRPGPCTAGSEAGTEQSQGFS